MISKASKDLKINKIVYKCFVGTEQQSSRGSVDQGGVERVGSLGSRSHVPVHWFPRLSR